jgi:hypothetical protein
MTDREKITEILKNYTKKNNISASVLILEEYAEELIANGVIVQKQGEWVSCGLDHNDMEIIKCSECGRKQFGYSKYCANCGAKMKELGK